MVRAINDKSGSTPNRDRIFTPVQATAMLPLIRRIASDLVALSQSIQTQRSQIREIDRMTVTIEIAEYRDELRDIRTSLEADEASIESCLAELVALGVLPHDPIDGGVDFPGIMNRRSVRFCWLPGEPIVQYWHETDACCVSRELIES